MRGSVVRVWLNCFWCWCLSQSIQRGL